MTNIASLPALLRAVRASLNLTQEQLAERLGVSFATVNRWEGGDTQPQRAAVEAIITLAREAGVDEAGDTKSSAAPMVELTPRRGRAFASVPTTRPMEQLPLDAVSSILG